MAEPISSNVYRTLRGIFCVYKPLNISTNQLMKSLRLNLSKELCKYPLTNTQAEVMTQCNLVKSTVTQYLPSYQCQNLSKRGGPFSESLEQKEDRNLIIAPQESSEVTRVAQKDSPLHMDAEDVQFHPLVLGDLWRPQDVWVTPIDTLSTYASGVLPVAIGRAAKSSLKVIRMSNPVRVYRATMTLGIATDNYLSHGNVLERVKIKHVTQAMVDRVLAGAQAAHSKQQFDLAGVDLQTQEAYELASKGMLRPEYSNTGTQTIIYSVKPVEFSPPELQIEITCVNETGLSLARFIHDLGIDLRCGAVCNKLRRLRFGYFDVSHALTHLQWDSSSIIGNIETCQPITALAMLDRANQLAESTKNKHNLLKGSVAD